MTVRSGSKADHRLRVESGRLVAVREMRLCGILRDGAGSSLTDTIVSSGSGRFRLAAVTTV